MISISKLSLSDKLPLTCSRSGTCCFGKRVSLNPWELVSLAESKKMTPREFRDKFCEFGGIRLRFDGETVLNGDCSCSQYIPDFGCSVHGGRPLVCRLYPLGRQKQNETSIYIYQGKEFPCLKGCPEVTTLPLMTVADYVKGQAASKYETAQDEYLEVMQNLADGAFVLLLESGLAGSGDKTTLKLWREMANEEPELLTDRLGSQWIDSLMLPDLKDYSKDPAAFAGHHYDLILLKAEESFSALETFSDYSWASGLMMGLALHLGRSLGAEPLELAELWINTAKQHGALE